MPELTPRQIVAELDKYIVGQTAAKRAVAVAIRNRWRRQQLPPDLRKDVTPKNIIMIGPTGVGKTEIARRLAQLVGAPFLKVEATKYTEVGYLGRDVEQMIRDLTEIAIAQCARKAQGRPGARASSRPTSACSMRWSARTRAPRAEDAFREQAAQRRTRRQGNRIEVQASAAACRCSKSPACGRADGRDHDRRHVRQDAARTKTRRVTIKELA